jgi:hypothetical protein
MTPFWHVVRTVSIIEVLLTFISQHDRTWFMKTLEIPTASSLSSCFNSGQRIRGWIDYALAAAMTALALVLLICIMP